MPQINYNKEIAETNTISRISSATGIDNFSDSSKIKNTARSISTDISNFIELVTDSIDSIYSSSATGRYLDLKGAEAGVYRNTISSIDIYSTDLVAEIRPRDEGKTFAEITAREVTIRKGEEIDVGSQFKIVFTDNVTFGPGISDVYPSLRIEVSDKSEGFSINPNDVFKVQSERAEVLAVAPFIELVFHKGIGLSSQNETDLEFRSKVIFARENSSVAVPGAIQTVVQSIPNYSGHSIYLNDRGSSTIDIGFITKVMQEDGADPSADSIKQLLEFRLRNVIAEGADYNVFMPLPLLLNIEYNYSSELSIPDETIVDAIYAGFSNSYIYSEENTVNSSSIETFVESILPSIDNLSITSLSLFDPEIKEYISFGSSFAAAPKGTFITLSRADIKAE